MPNHTITSAARPGPAPVESRASRGQAATQTQPSHWGGVFAMTLCVFALVASEFMPVSLLTPIAADMHITEGTAGLAVAMSGAFAVLTSLVMPALSGRTNRKAVLLWMTACMALSGAVIAFAQSFPVYMLGRALIGVSVGGFWSISAATAIRLVPAAQVTRALAIFNGGNALATVVAAPLGSYIGALAGWRGAFFCLVPVAAIAFAWQWVSLPSMETQTGQSGSRNVLRLLGNPLVFLGMAAVSIFFMGQFALYTYVRPFLETTTRLDAATLSAVLLTIGVAGFVGTSAIGWFISRDLYRTLVVIPVVLAAIAVALVVFGSQPAMTTGLLAAWGLLATAAPVGWWSWVAQTMRENAEAGGSLMVAVVQLAIGAGSAVGGVLFDVSGSAGAFAAGAALMLCASVLALATSRRSQALASAPPRATS